MKIKITILFFFLVIAFTAITNLQAEPRRVLLEFCTGTWCPWCPCGDWAAEQILATYPQTLVLAYHGAGSDPWQFFNGYEVRSLLGFAAYPTGIIDRTNHPGYNSQTYVTYNMWMGLVQARYANSPNTTINVETISKSYNSSTRQLTMNVNCTALQQITSQHKISFVITEEYLIYNQANNGVCVSGGTNWVHHWTVRSMANGPTGENINTGTWNQNQVISKSLTTTLDGSWIAENCNVYVLVYREDPNLYLAELQQAQMVSATNPLGITTQQIPTGYSLSQNYPNPFNPMTNIYFSIPKDGDITLKIYDMLGREVATYFDGFIKAGNYHVEVDASSWTSGVYFYVMKAKDFSDTKRMTLVK